MANAQILVASDGEIAQIKVEGRATYRCCPEIKSFANSFLEQEKYQFIINLEGCEGMDSTFMGVLALIGIPCKQNQSPVTIVNTNAENRKLLDSLGVSRLFTFKELDDSENWLLLSSDNASDVDRKTGEIMLEAHETLNTVDPENIPKFKDVIDFLREDLDDLDEN